MESEGASFKSMHFPRGVQVREGGSVTMKKCTVTGREIELKGGASLVMEECRIFGSSGFGLVCLGKVAATLCIFEGNALSGVCVAGEATLQLVGGTTSGHQVHGVRACGGKVTVAAAEHTDGGEVEQTVSSGNGGDD